MNEYKGLGGGAVRTPDLMIPIPKRHIWAGESVLMAQEWLDGFDVLEQESILMSGDRHGVWLSAYGTRIPEKRHTMVPEKYAKLVGKATNYVKGDKV